MKVLMYLFLIVSVLFSVDYVTNKDGKQYAFSSKKVEHSHIKNIKKSLGIQ